MKVSELRRFLDGQLTSQQLSTLIAAEVDEHFETLQKTSVAPVIIEADETNVCLSQAQLVRLCTAACSQELPIPVFIYTVEAIQMSDAFIYCSSDLEDAIDYLADQSGEPISRTEICDFALRCEKQR